MIKESIQQFRANRRQRDRLGTQAKTQQRLGLAQRDATETRVDIRSAQRNINRATEPQYDPVEKINSWYDEVDALRQERGMRTDMERSTSGALEEEMRPERRYETEFRGEVQPPVDLETDTEFTSAVSNLAEKYNITPTEVYAVIQGESAFNPQARNPSGATGLFQFMPAVAEELGTSSDAIMAMSPTEQVALYDKYLSRWNYSGDNRLGIMQAAPAYASRGPEEVIYAEGTAAWEQNPGWRELGNGPITVQSINSYYAKRANS
jgi:soluble lytic murein transglycosylase-like protein